MKYKVTQTVTEVRNTYVELAEGSTFEQIYDEALTAKYSVKFSEVEDIEIFDENGAVVE